MVLVDLALSGEFSEPMFAGSTTKAQYKIMQQFLIDIEKKAYRMAQVATQNSDDALDIVQDSMLKLVTQYSERPQPQWKPLFYRILQSKIADYFRKKKLHQAIFFWKPVSDDDDKQDYFIEQFSDHITPEKSLHAQQELLCVLNALKQLPYRQQQCFILRSWEGLSVADTADIMGCSVGSVKTHYSRAKKVLEQQLQTFDASLSEIESS